MDLSKYLSGGEPPVTEEQPRMSKEEYAALKKAGARRSMGRD